MTIAVDARINLPDFKRQLQAIDADLRLRAVRNATRAAGRAISKEAKAIVAQRRGTVGDHIRTGLLEKNVAVLTRRRQSAGSFRVIVGVRTNKRRNASVPFYWRFLEGGWIPRGRGNKLRGGARTRALVRNRESARKISFPFLKPAFDAKKVEAIAAFENSIGAAVKRWRTVR